MILLRWLLNTLVLMLVANIAPGVSFESFWSALITSLIFGIINAVVRPLMIVLTLPINVLTLGLFTLIINALMFWLAASIVEGFVVASFWSAFFGALIYWLIVTAISFLEKK